MAQGHALLVGLTRVDVTAHGGWTGEHGCLGCELDVDNVARILQPLGYRVNTLKTAQATHDAVLDGLRGLARVAKAGDAVVFYYSGHGGQQPDKNGDERDHKDETLVAYDRDIVDDEMFEVLTQFRASVRVVMMSDSCNSGTNYRGLSDQPDPTPFQPFADDRRARADDLSCMLIHMGGCRDGGTSAGYEAGGAFTQALCNVWDGGKFRGTLAELHARIAAVVKAARERQQVTFSAYPGASDAFRNQQAFAVVGS